MRMRPIHPSAGRVVLALISAIAAAAAPTLILGPIAIVALPAGVVIAAAHALLLALPAYLVLRRWCAIDWVAAILAGVLIGATPVLLWALVELASVDGGDFAARNLAFAGAIFGFCGMFGGIAFRAALGEPEEEPLIDPSIFD